jgi:hypothetical protein
MSGWLPALANLLWISTEVLIGLAGGSAEMTEWLTRTDC